MNKQKETKKTDPYEKTPEDLNKKTLKHDIGGDRGG